MVWIRIIFGAVRRLLPVSYLGKLFSLLPSLGWKLWVIVGLLFANIGSGYVAYRCYYEPEPSREVVDVNWEVVDEEFPMDEIVFVEMPDLVEEYSQEPETVVVDSVQVPVGLGINSFRLTSPRPVEVGSDRVRLSLFNPNTGRWSQQTYQVPDPSFGMSASLRSLFQFPHISDTPIIEADLSIRYNNLKLRGSYARQGPVDELEVAPGYKNVSIPVRRVWTPAGIVNWVGIEYNFSL